MRVNKETSGWERVVVTDEGWALQWQKDGDPVRTPTGLDQAFKLVKIPGNFAVTFPEA